MIDIQELKRIDPTLQKYSDKELIDIRALLYSAAELTLECYVESKSVSKYPVGDNHKVDDMV